MECLKCKKECIESELTGGVCSNCLNGKSNLSVLTISIVASAITAFLIMIAVASINATSTLSNFSVSDFTYSTSTSSYTYIDSTISYVGNCNITTADSLNDYIVIVEVTHTSGGDLTNVGNTDIRSIIVHNGKGNLQTYDSGSLNEIMQPKYEVKILSYQKFAK